MAQVTGTPSRFAGLSQRQAIAVLVALFLSITVSSFLLRPPASSSAPSSSATNPAERPQASGTQNHEDLALYRKITTRVAHGETYYKVAADEQRRGGYPLHPFVVVRLPTLALVSATLGQTATAALLYALLGITLLVWAKRLDGCFGASGGRVTALGTIVATMIIVFSREFQVMHEIWAGLLLALVFGIHRPDRWIIAACVAGVALFIRELALPFVLLMIAFAMVERRWREVATLSAIVGLFALFMSYHAGQVAAVTTAADPSSPGWMAIGGWPAVVRTTLAPGPLRFLPENIGAIIMILSLFGWASWHSRTGLFGTLLFIGYGVFFMLFGRPDNFYWGLIVIPTFLIGLAFLPRAFSDLRAVITPKLDFTPA